MKQSFIISGKTTPAKFILEYNEGGYLIQFSSEDANDAQLRFMHRSLPFTIEKLNEFKTLHKAQLNVAIQQQDLSFEAFWKAYNYKVGKKAQTERSWENLSKANRAKALAYIQRYKQTCTLNGVAMAYPSTYLNQRYFDNE